jgi:hypothetical protein
VHVNVYADVNANASFVVVDVRVIADVDGLWEKKGVNTK